MWNPPGGPGACRRIRATRSRRVPHLYGTASPRRSTTPKISSARRHQISRREFLQPLSSPAALSLLQQAGRNTASRSSYGTPGTTLSSLARIRLLLGLAPTPGPRTSRTASAISACGLLTQIPHSAPRSSPARGLFLGPSRSRGVLRGPQPPPPADRSPASWLENCPSEGLSLEVVSTGPHGSLRSARWNWRTQSFLHVWVEPPTPALVRDQCTMATGGRRWRSPRASRRSLRLQLSGSGRRCRGWSTWLGRREGSDPGCDFSWKGWFPRVEG